MITNHPQQQLPFSPEVAPAHPHPPHLHIQQRHTPENQHIHTHTYSPHTDTSHTHTTSARQHTQEPTHTPRTVPHSKWQTGKQHNTPSRSSPHMLINLKHGRYVSDQPNLPLEMNFKSSELAACHTAINWKLADKLVREDFKAQLMTNCPSTIDPAGEQQLADRISTIIWHILIFLHFGRYSGNFICGTTTSSWAVTSTLALL